MKLLVPAGQVEARGTKAAPPATLTAANSGEFAIINKQAWLNSLTFTPKQWIEKNRRHRPNADTRRPDGEAVGRRAGVRTQNGGRTFLSAEQNVSLHAKNIFEDGELVEGSVVK